MFRRPAATAVLALAGSLALIAQAQTPRFFDDDPLMEQPVTQDVTDAVRYEPDLVFQTLQNLFGRPGDRVTGQRAKNVNTIDEVPDGPFFHNRAGRVPLTPELVNRAANTGDGPPPPPLTIVSAKSDGITPGFTVRDTQGGLWFIKFDPPGWRGMATGSEITTAKLFWALGYHTVEYYIGHLRASDLAISADAMITTPDGRVRRLDRGDIARLLARTEREADGTARVIFSKAAPGRPVGRLGFHGTRPDDPNDLVPHEHHRELRAYGVFSAWLNHADAKSINSLSTLVTENGRTFIKHFLLDFGSSLGSAAVGPREEWEGYEELVEKPGEIGRRAASFGLRVPEWRRIDFYESPAIGRLPRDHSTWNPDTWQAHISNAAFRHARADDRFWAAHTLTFVTEPMIRAAVASGEFGDPEAEDFLVRAIVERRQRILEAYLPAVNPIVDPSLDAAGRLTFRNAAVDAGVSAIPERYRAEWARFDNLTGAVTPLGTTEAPGTDLPPPPSLPDNGFIQVLVSAHGGPEAWTRPVVLHFRYRAGWQLVGLERQVDPAPSSDTAGGHR